MSKHVTAPGYIGAWLVAVIAGIVFFKTANFHSTGTSAAYVANTPSSFIAGLVVGLALIVMVVMWIGALIELGMQHAWGWFVAVLVLHLIALGIVAMIAYAVAGPDRVVESVTRPSFT